MIALEVALQQAAARLAEAGIEAPRREARLLAGHLLGRAAGALLGDDLTVDQSAWDRLVARRVAHEPMAFITGKTGFWTLELEAGPQTLIPRADSETLIEAAIASFAQADPVRRILDLGTGTGCLLLAALSIFGEAFGVGLDAAPDAALLAQRNAAACGLAGRTAFLAGSWADALGPGARFDLVLTNPPYIMTADLPGLMPEVAGHEPMRALDGGPDGLRSYEAILTALPRLLEPAGLAVLELGAGQREAVMSLAEARGLAEASCRDDLGGIPRALVLQRAGFCNTVPRRDPARKKPFGNADVGS